MARFLRPSLAFALVMALAACGFHLKGPAALKPEFASIYLDSVDPYSDLHRSVVEALSGAGAVLLREHGDAAAVLELRKEETGRRIITVSAQNVPLEYEVYYNVTYRVFAGGKEVLKPTQLSLSRVVIYDVTVQLEKEREEEIVRDALSRDLAERIVRQLAAL